MRRKDPAIRDALDRIVDEDERGRLRPEAVLQAARSPKSVLHAQFEWDDSVAGEQWRLQQARMLINRYYVVIDQEPEPVKTRAYVSLKSERVQGGGYTPIRRVLSEPELHAEMLRNAGDDLDAMERRYSNLKELRPIWTEWHRVRRRIRVSREDEQPPHAAA